MKLFKSQTGFFLAVSLLLSTVVPQGVQASVMRNYDVTATSSESKIDETFDRFHYTMAVEWDQRDENFRIQAENDLADALLALQASGITMSSIQKRMEKSLLKGKNQKEYRRFLQALKSQNVSPEEASKLTSKFMEKNYAEGTHFNGEGSHNRGKIIAAIIIIAVVTYIIIRNNRGGDNDHHDNNGHGKPGNGKPCYNHSSASWNGNYGGYKVPDYEYRNRPTNLQCIFFLCHWPRQSFSKSQTLKGNL